MNFAEKFIAGEFAVSSSHLLSGLTAYSSHFVLCVFLCHCPNHISFSLLSLEAFHHHFLLHFCFCTTISAYSIDPESNAKIYLKKMETLLLFGSIS
jgi:hypothetical protein